MSRNRLCLFTEHFPNQDGGIAQWAYGVARNLALESISVDVLAPKKCFKNGRADPSPASLSVMGGRNWHDMRNLYMLYYTLKVLIRNGRMPFLCSCWDMATVPVLFSKLLGFPVFTAAHGLEVARTRRGLARKLMELTLSGSTGVLAGSRFTSSLIDKSVAGRARVRVMGYGVDPQIFAPAPRPGYLVERYNLSGKKVVLTLARLTERKGQDTMIRALPRVIQSFPDVVYLIAGKGGYRKHLEMLARDLRLEDHVVFCGYVPPEEIVDHYNLCDVYAMVSREIESRGDVEGFGITYLEAGACAKPVVACGSGGVSDAVEHGVNGLMVPPDSPDAVADALVSLLGNSDLATNLGKAGRRRVEETFNWQAIARRLKAAMGYESGDGPSVGC